MSSTLYITLFLDKLCTNAAKYANSAYLRLVMVNVFSQTQLTFLNKERGLQGNSQVSVLGEALAFKANTIPFDIDI